MSNPSDHFYCVTNQKCGSTEDMPLDYIPTVMDNHMITHSVDSEYINIGVWDTAEPEDYRRIMYISFAMTDVRLKI